MEKCQPGQTRLPPALVSFRTEEYATSSRVDRANCSGTYSLRGVFTLGFVGEIGRAVVEEV